MTPDKKHAAPQWWEGLIACPVCGTAYQDKPSEKVKPDSCPGCGLSYMRQNNIFAWNALNAPKKELQWQDVWRKTKNQLNPMANRLSPLRLLNDLRVEAYYKKTLTDVILAERWGKHYLEGLALKKGDVIFDHGCGRGRNVALATQLGYRVVGQDIKPNTWWRRLSTSGFQVVHPTCTNLPWASEAFSALINVGVIHYLTEEQLKTYIQEVFRVLKPGGYWLLLEANDKSYGAYLPKQLIGQLYPLHYIQQLGRNNGFEEIDYSFEGFYAPIFPRFVNFIRKQCSLKSFNVSDYGSCIESLTPPECRACWLLRLRKPLVKK